MKTADPFAPLRGDVSYLGRMLGQVLVEQEGAALLELEESIRALAKERRKRGRRGPVAKRMHALIETLTANDAERVARAFAHYFQLVNLAEQHHRIRRRRDHARESDSQAGSFAHEIPLLAATLRPSELAKLLAKTRIELVFTAHPSEAQRRTVLEKHRRIARLLARRDVGSLAPDERREIERALREEITTLWQTDEIRSERPRVSDEVKNALFYLEDVLFPLVPRFYEALERAVGPDVRVPTILHFGSWVGADMDGNPNVTPDVALDTAYAQAARILGLYLGEVATLGGALSQSTRRVGVSAELEASIARDAERMPLLATELAPKTEEEPYRRKLRFIEARLTATRAAVASGRRTGATSLAVSSDAYARPVELLADLEVIARSLAQNRGDRAGLHRVRALVRQVETFGFHLAKLDVRVPAAWIRSDDPRGLAAIETIAQIRAITGGGGAESFILSMTHGAEDMIAALDLAERAGLVRENAADVSIVPLFETLDDLGRSADEIGRAAGNPRYGRYLDSRGRMQEIMIGYSDSNKDAGILAASFALYRAQQRLVETAKKNRLRLVVFHGRGGSIGRGGGPAQRAIESLPHGSIDGRFKLTEQGEVLGWKYLLSEIAERNLEITASGVLAASAVDTHTRAAADVSEFEDAFEDVARVSLERYRALVGDPEFIRYFEGSTPLAEISMLNIGSRPSRRPSGAPDAAPAKTSGRAKGPRRLEDLRAIPWVFAWTQSRQIVPGWFGAGEALTHLLRTRGVSFARRMYEEWPFFASTLDAIAASLAIADIDIASRYAALARDPSGAWRGVAGRLFTMIARDHGRATRRVATVLGEASVLARRPTLARSIELRNPYVDSLSFIQLELLRRKRELIREGQEVPHELSRALLLTINGIAAGLRNTG